jgi:hypothetical protein
VESLAFLEALIGALGRGWSARYGILAPYSVLGVTLTSDAGRSVEVVPARVRGDVVIWSPLPFARGTPHYELYTDDFQLLRTEYLTDAVAWLARWRKAHGPIGRAVARIARAGAKRAKRAKRPVRTTEVDTIQSLTDALRDKRLGRTDRARKLAKQCDRDQAARALLAIARGAWGDARANALDVLVSVGRHEDGPELVRYLADPERSVRRVAIDGIKRVGYTPAIPVLAALVLDRDRRPTSGRSRLAVEAATAMKALSGRRGAAALTGYLTSRDPRVREAACVAFTLFANPGTKQARPLIERLLTDRDARVARAAKRALATL